MVAKEDPEVIFSDGDSFIRVQDGGEIDQKQVMEADNQQRSELYSNSDNTSQLGRQMTLAQRQGTQVVDDFDSYMDGEENKEDRSVSESPTSIRRI